MTTRRVHVVVEGRVQGVFFRAHTEEEARRLGLTGWVRNRADGSVEAVLQGESEAVAALLRWLERGSPQSVVTRLRLSEEEPTAEFTDFRIRR